MQNAFKFCRKNSIINGEYKLRIVDRGDKRMLKESNLNVLVEIPAIYYNNKALCDREYA
jgi:hypothetical protein